MQKKKKKEATVMTLCFFGWTVGNGAEVGF
jgi:hypothetical protein